jgi:fluoroquinolone transport system permease protein
MRQLVSAARWDVALQIRNGFYVATVVVTLFWALLLVQAPQLDWRWLLPPMLIGNLLLGTFYFIGGLLLLERAEGTLYALAVTPLPVASYLAAKVLTLAALAVGETLILAAILVGREALSAVLVTGVLLASAIYCLAGVVAVARYESISAYLLPSTVVVTLLWIPLLAYLAGWRPWLIYLHPLMAPLSLVEAGLGATPWWYAIYGVGYSALWVGVLFVWSCRELRDHLLGESRRSD